ncbi:paraquat-inducible protein A [Hydrogenimonas cancrithermarum]|nr:paraquat-inducible protein A [Hydrogenimonas cancrithermarum]
MKKTACPECGIVIDIPQRLDFSHYHCPRCKMLLHRRGQPFSHIIVMAFTTLLLAIPLTFLPILSLNIMGVESSATLVEVLWQLYQDGYTMIAIFTMLTAFAIPMGMMALLLMILVPLKMGYKPQRVALYYRIYETARRWGMVEVYLISIIVAIVKLHKMATLHVGFGLFIFVFFFITFYITTVWFNPDDIWDDDALAD